MFDIVLFEPEIPPNTGNIIRLAANTGSCLHLVGKLGFSMDEKSLRRAGLDYHQYSNVARHDSWETFLESCRHRRIFAFSTKGSLAHSGVSYQRGDILLFGPETRGLPEAMLFSPRMHAILKLPMVPGSRSLNLSNAVAVAVYEAWRQLEFAGSGV
jgi:tRNA (cytidine/uridine-2'-O-)-methyltransferase